MLDPNDAPLGSTVYLRPQTRQAPGICYQRVAAVLTSVDQWPYVLVEVAPTHADLGVKPTVYRIHRDNVGLHPAANQSQAADKKEGDSVGSNATPPVKPRVMPGKPVPIDTCDGLYDEQVLF